MEVKPTAGRIVYYKTRGSADDIYKPEQYPAMITRVEDGNEGSVEEGNVDLVVFYPTGIRFELNVPHGEDIAEWDWMPFQKDQQARLAPGTMNESHVGQIGSNVAPNMQED